jgi:hypothetical protein
VLFLFIGHLPTKNVPDKVSAASANGICIFLTLLKDIELSPLVATEIEVIPGHINHADHFYTFVEDASSGSHEETGFLGVHELGSSLYDLSARDYELVVVEQQSSDTLGAEYRAASSGYSQLSIPPAALQISLQTFLRLDVTNSNSTSTLFEVEDNGLYWSLQELVSTGRPGQMAGCTKARALTWSILDWKARTNPLGQAQHLDIELFRLRGVAILITALGKYSETAACTPWNRRCYVMLLNTGSYDISVVRRAALAWSVTEADTSSESIQMGGLRKKVSVKTSLCCRGQNFWDVAFELSLHPPL